MDKLAQKKKTAEEILSIAIQNFIITKVLEHPRTEAVDDVANVVVHDLSIAVANSVNDLLAGLKIVATGGKVVKANVN